MIEAFFTTLAVLLRIFSNPVGNVFQKKLTSQGKHPLMVNFLTYLFLSVISIFIAIQFDWKELPRQFWFYSVLGGIAGALGNGFLVKALQKGDLSILGPINSYKSVVGIIVALFLLHEVPNYWGIAGVILIIFGSYFVLDTTDEKFTCRLFKKPEIQFRIWAMILTAIEAVFIKKIILFSSATLAFISWCWFGALFSLFILILYRVKIRDEFKKTEKNSLIKYLWLVGCVGIMQFSTNYVFDHMQVGFALSLFQLSTIVSVILGYKVFQESEIRKKLIGTTVMIVGSILIILFKNL